MKSIIIYYSRTGRTKLIAQTLAKEKNMNIVELITKLIVFMEATHVFVQNIQDQLKPNHVVAVVLAVIYTNKVIVVVIVIVVLTKNS